MNKTIGLIVLLLTLRLSSAVAQQGRFDFSEAVYSINEDGGFIAVNVERNGGSMGTVSCKFETFDLTATSPTDFQAQSIGLTFLDGAIGPAQLTVPVVDRNGAVGNRRFGVRLINPSGGVTIGLGEAVVIIASPDSQPPSAMLTAPAPGLVVAETAVPSVAVRADARDNEDVAKLQVKLNNGIYVDVPADPPASSVEFNTTVTPVPGPNTVTVRSVDFRGNVSPEVTRTFIYRVVRSLSVTVTGPPNAGKVTPPFPGSNDLEVGQAYTLTATANPGFVFTGWTGGLTSPAAIFTFTMLDGLSLTANFAEDPRVVRGGKYQGLVTSQSPVPGSIAATGLLSLTVQSTGAFSGKMRIDGRSFVLKGLFTSDGVAHFGRNGDTTVSLQRGGKLPLLLSLHLDTAGSSDQITGTLRDEGGSSLSAITLDRALYSSKPKPPFIAVPPELSGSYTVLFSPKAVTDQIGGLAAGAFPQGAGWATVKVDANGVAKMAGVLADGTRVSASAPLSKTNRFAFFASIYSNQGFVSGAARFRDVPGSDLDGSDVVWSRPVQTKAKYYPNGWPSGILTDLKGSKFVKPSAGSGNGVFTMIQAPNDTTGNALAAFTDGDLPGPLDIDVNVSETGKVGLVMPVDGRFSAKFTASTGVFKGTFQPAAGGPVSSFSFQGVVLQKINSASGFFFGPTTVGNARIEPK